jgi:uncharacterized GH25 family protein
MKTVGFLRTLTLLLVTLSVAASAFGHDTWLIPNSFSIPTNTTLFLDLTSGMAFPAPDTPIKPERVGRAKCRLAGHSFDLGSFSPAPKSLRFKARLYEPGIATLWVELKPRALELTPEQVEEYFEEIDAPESVRQQWANAGKRRRWREVYTKHSKTFVRVGEARPDGSWAEPVGMSLEIVPEKDPTSLRAGDDFPVRVLKNGTPLRDFPVGIVSEGSSKGEIGKTDAEGRVSFRLSKKGRWLLRGTELRRTTASGADWESDFTTLTIEVARE